MLLRNTATYTWVWAIDPIRKGLLTRAKKIIAILKCPLQAALVYDRIFPEFGRIIFYFLSLPSIVQSAHCWMISDDLYLRFLLEPKYVRGTIFTTII
jgi:hypothetical protein